MSSISDASPSIDDLRVQVPSKLDLADPYIADTAMTIAADYPGEYNINQMAAIYNAMAGGGWFYYSEADGTDYFQSANMTLQRGKISSTIGRGDCDDFAILMASLIESLGGSCRITFAYDIQKKLGHAYAEVYLGQIGDPEVDQILSWLKEQYSKTYLQGINMTADEVWLNLDWGDDPKKASYPGGPNFGNLSQKFISKVIREPDHRTTPKIVPLIDSMESTAGWELVKDEKGSSLNLSTIPGKKGNATQIAYDIKEGGFVGISREINPAILAQANGINFSCFVSGNQNTIQLRLICDDGIVFGASWNVAKKEIWESYSALYSKLRCLSSGCNKSNEFNVSEARRLEFRISGDLTTGDELGPGAVILDQVQGTMAVPVGSPWARAEAEREASMAKDLAAQSERALSSPAGLIESVQLAVESLSHNVTFDGDLALRRGLALLPRPVAEIRHNDRVWSVAFSPEGKRLATGCADGTAMVWDAFSGKKLLNSPLKHNGIVYSVAFSPDGKWLATGSDDSTARIWDIQTGQEIKRLEHNRGVLSVDFSPDGKRLATGSKDGIAMVWNASSGERLLLYPLMHHGMVYSVAFSQDGTRLATGSEDRTAKVWDASTGALLLGVNHPDQVHSVDFNPNGTWLVTGSRDGKARIWNGSTGKELFSLDHCTNVVYSVAFSPDGKKLATASRDKTAKVWDLSTGNVQARMGHEDLIWAISFSPDGERLATASFDGTSRVWDVATRELACVKFEDDVQALVVSPDGTKMAAGSEDKTAMVWNLSARKAQFYLPKQDSGVISIAFSPDGKKLAMGTRGGNATVWDASSGSIIFDLPGHKGTVYSVAFSPDGTRIATACEDHNARVWNASTGKLLLNLSGHNASVTKVAFSPDGTKIATASEDYTARIWDASTGELLLHPLEHAFYVFSIAFSPDGEKLATGSNNAEIWDLSNGDGLPLNNGGYRVNSVAFSPDGRKLATASYDNLAWIWDVSTGEDLLKISLGSYGYAVAFSPDGTMLATGSRTGCPEGTEARIWDVQTGQEMQRLGHDDDVVLVTFSPDGEKLITASLDGTARAWYIQTEDLVCEACRRLTLNLTSADWWDQYCGDCPAGRL
ncbi:MAG: transglutaminase domain-containing protein [Methanothrix sp.]